MASPTRRQTILPTYDTAPDIYETPDLTDSTATTLQTQRTSSPSASETSTDDEAEEDDEDMTSGVVSRRRLYPERARKRFGADVSAERVDLSDRIDGRRRGLRVRSKRRSEVDAEEGLEARMARLRREVAECKVLAEKEERGNAEGVEELSALLARIEDSRVAGRERQAVERSATLEDWADADGSEEQTLNRVADFDARLSALEQALGISALEVATDDAVAMPLLPTLTLLDEQLSVLSSATSLASLEAASGRLAKLRREADSLSHSQVTAHSRPSTATSIQQNGTIQDSESDLSQFTASDISKLHSLYQLLPTLQSLSPTVPALLNRLRSLRTLHTSAASAESALEDVEQRQREADAELRGLEGGAGEGGAGGEGGE